MSIEPPWSPKHDRVSGPTLHHVQSTWLTYETFYGLKEKPFSLSSDPAFFYSSPSHAAALDDLLSGIRRRESLSVLTGDIGTGKTTLCRTLLQNLDHKTFSAFVPDPFASREDLLKMVLMDFGVVSSDDFTSGRLKGLSRTELSFLLYEFLGTLAPLQAFAVVFIDEAQNLSLPLLEEIRILSDSDGREKQLQVVLVGQLELRQKLKLPEMRQVDQRVSVRCSLGPLDRDGVAGYVEHRLRMVGGSPDRITFSQDATEAAYAASGGVPRVINRICDRALHLGHLRRAALLDREIIEIALADIETRTVVIETAIQASTQAAPEPVNDRFAAVDRRVTGSPGPSPVEVADDSFIPASTQAAPERVDDWFAAMDRRVEAAAGTSAVEVTDDLFVPAIVPEVQRTERVRAVRAVQPTRTEALRRTWLRRLKVAVLLVVLLSGAGLGFWLAWTILLESTAPPHTAAPWQPPQVPAVKSTTPTAP